MPARGDAESRSKRSGNLASRLKFGTKLREAVLCFIAGLAVSIIFYPINFPFYSFIALIPILWISYFLGPGSFWKGYFFGFGHFVSCFAWLNEVFPGSSFGLALAYSFLTASWNFLTTRLLFNLDYGKLKDLAPKNAKEPLYPDTFTIGKVIFFCGLSAAIWVCMESVRSIIFTGLPWNQLGACLWAYPRLISIVSFTGIYGLSFIIVFVNLNLFLILRNIYLIKKKNHPERFFNKKQCLPLLILVALFVVPVHTWESSENIRVALIQGNIPLEQMYNSNPKKALENLKLSEETYKELTFMAADEKPDLIIWPETALPRALRPGEPLMREIFNRVECPMIIGTVRRELRDGTKGLLIDDYRQYNSAIYFDEAGRVIDKYSKIHIVPFGEYTPFKDLWPKKILKYIYMGTLTRGKEHSVFKLGNASLGPSICYEDIFPELCRAPVNKGANILMSISNDAWFQKSSGAQQHRIHAVFRAVENARPFIRNGNNSDSCIILPNGKTVGLLRGPSSRFYRGYRIYDVPILTNPKLTFYTKYGNIFAYICNTVSLFGIYYLLYRFLDRKKRLHEKIKR